MVTGTASGASGAAKLIRPTKYFNRLRRAWAASRGGYFAYFPDESRFKLSGGPPLVLPALVKSDAKTHRTPTPKAFASGSTACEIQRRCCAGFAKLSECALPARLCAGVLAPLLQHNGSND